MIRLNKYSRLCLFYLFWVIGVPAKAQISEDGPVSILTPEAAAFVKYGNVPVSTYTGTANVSVPLYTIQDGDINLPISVNYNTSGIKVQEEATWVGLGWSLNTGGQITRTIRGKDDFEYQPGLYNYLSPDAINNKLLFSDGTEGGYVQSFFDPTNPNSWFWPNTTDTTALTVATHSGTINLFDPTLQFNPYDYDWVSDLFYFAAGTNSGKFVFDDNGLPMTLKKTNTTIQIIGGNNFQITDGKGVVYTYSLKDLNHSFLITAPDVISTWYLTSIKTADGNDSVTFQYSSGSARSNDVSTTSATVQSDGTLIYGLDSNYTTQSYWYLTEIDFRGGKVLFQSSGNRLDVDGQRQLDSVIIYNNHLTRVKEYGFKYSYFVATEGSNNTSTFYNDRLKLDSIVIDDSPSISYTFQYNMNNIPSKFAGVDHWGYFNNTGFGIPAGIYELPITSGGTTAITYQQYPGGNYEADWPLTEAMILQQVTYPTKGYTQFQYEPNQFGNVPAYWEYAVPPPPPTSTVMIFPVDSIDLGNYPITGTLNGFYNLYCHFYCSDTTDLGDIEITILDGSGNIIISDQLSNFTHSYYNFDYYLTLNNLNLSGNLYCRVDDVRQDRTVSNANFYQEWQLTLTAVNTQGGTGALTYLNIPSINGGGLRISQVTDADGMGGLMNKQYNYNNPDGTTSGVIMNYPVYLGFPAYIGGNIGIYGYLSSTSVIGLSQSAGGSYIGYSHVTETDGDSTNNIGRTEYDYTNSPDILPSQYGIGLPPVQTMENGLLLKSVQYDVNNDTVLETVNSYPSYIGGVDTNWNSSTGVIFIQYLNEGAQGGTITGPTSLAPVYLWRDFQLDYRLQTNVKSSFGSNGSAAAVVTTTQYQYGDNVNPRIVNVSTSTSNQDQTEYRYANDFTASAVPGFVQDMQNYNILDKPIETVVSKIINGSDMAIGGKLDQYGTGNTRGLVLNEYSLDLSAPLAWGDANFSNSLSGSSFVFNPNYTIQNSFDLITGKIANYRNRQHDMAFLWDYNYKYPIASCINSTDTVIAYTSFEADGSGNWLIGSGSVDTTTAITGSNSYVLSNNSSISASGLNSSTTYIVSYWTMNHSAFNISGTISGYPLQGKTEIINGKCWTLYVHKVTGQSTIIVSGSGHIDELRLYPSTAQMTTYTYSPLVGMTSQTDVGNRVTYYEYDGLARLQRVRDQDYNILKTYEYQYQVPAGCNGCQSVAMQTFLGTNTIGYPVGVFDIHGNLVGNAAGASAYVNLWNSDTADARVGTLSTSNDSLHFNIVLNAGQTLPASVTGCRYYQVDMAWSQIDAVRPFNGTYIDFGDSTGMRMNPNPSDTPITIAPNTTLYAYYDNAHFFNTFYIIHTYHDTSLKTITCYHNDAAEDEDFDNLNNPATGLTRLKNLRGNLPANTTYIGGSCYQQPGMTSLANIANWSSIHSIQYFRFNNGDNINPCENISYPQDFLAGDPGLLGIQTAYGIRRQGVADTAFKISRLKSNWNTWFTQLQQLWITEDDWNDEDLTALKYLNNFYLEASTQDDQQDPNSPLVPLDSTEIDNILIQIAAGAGQSGAVGRIHIITGGSSPSSASALAQMQLANEGWTIIIDTTTR